MQSNLIQENFSAPELKNWEYPQLKVNVAELEDKNHIDLSDSVRYQDCIGQPFKWTDLKGKELENYLNEWNGYDDKDDIRIPNSYKNGGRYAENPKITQKMRTISKEFVYKVGKHILSGNFNLTTIPFPIKAMVPRSHLEYVGCLPTAHFPLYMNLAAKSSDPLERFKLYIIASVSYFHLTTSFGKPLNPIIGETFNGYYDDGTRVYLEQISHHPPIAYQLVYGPNECYKFYGPSQFSASAGLNSLTLNTKAWRKVEFKEPFQRIHNSLPNEYYSGTLLGTTVHETIGIMDFYDDENKIHCKINFGSVKKKPSDYIDAAIEVDGKPVAQIKGTYLGWIEIDGKRYFDHRQTQLFQCHPEKPALHSDVNMRNDKALLSVCHYDEAQKEKEALEQIQRTDAKLRKQYKAQKGIASPETPDNVEALNADPSSEAK